MELGWRERASESILSAAAAHAGRTVLRYDADFDMIAAVTGLPFEWVAPRNSIWLWMS